MRELDRAVKTCQIVLKLDGFEAGELAKEIEKVVVRDGVGKPQGKRSYVGQERDKRAQDPWSDRAAIILRIALQNTAQIISSRANARSDEAP